MVDRTKSIEELEGCPWPVPEFDSHLVTEIHRLRRVPLRDLATEDLRILIGQKVGLEYTVPLAVEQLEENPIAAGSMYRGDLLANVINVPTSFWQSHPELNNRLVEIKIELEEVADTIATELLPSMGEFEFR